MILFFFNSLLSLSVSLSLTLLLPHLFSLSSSSLPPSPLLHPSHQIALTLGNLSVAYSDLGQPQRSIELLQRALDINKHIHGPDHISVAITLCNLSIAYRHLGDVHKSEDLAKEALRKTEAIHGRTHPGEGVPLVK